MSTVRPEGYARGELRALAEFLNPELALEVARLQDLEHRHREVVDELAETRSRLRASTIHAGDLAERVAKAERRLVDLGAEEISKARRAAYLGGDAFVRVTSSGRGRFDTVHVPAGQVVLRADD